MSKELGNKEIMAKNLKYYMNLHNVNRNKLSKDLNIKYTTLTDWIKAKTYPRIDKIELLANYFKISKSSLVEEYNKKNDITDIYNQLEEKRQDKVYTYAKKQFEEQQKARKPKSSDFPDYFKQSDIQIARAYLDYFDKYEARFYATGTFDYDKLSDAEAITLANELKRVEREDNDDTK